MPEPDASGDVQGVPVIGVRPSAGFPSAGFARFVPVFADADRPENPTHVAHSLAPEAQAARREAVIRELPALSATEEMRLADAVLRVLGLAS